jgi:hypothetical protein
MARMYPDDIEGYEAATEGEKRVFRFIREAARPHKEFICWYEPPIGSAGMEPDFILYGRKLGILVIEVKDWTSQQIVSYNPRQFTVLVSGREEKTTNPDRQAKGYVHTLRKRLQEFPEFCSQDPRYKDHIKIPIGRTVVFPNISRDEYAQSNFKERSSVIPRAARSMNGLQATFPSGTKASLNMRKRPSASPYGLSRRSICRHARVRARPGSKEKSWHWMKRRLGWLYASGRGTRSSKGRRGAARPWCWPTGVGSSIGTAPHSRGSFWCVLTSPWSAT